MQHACEPHIRGLRLYEPDIRSITSCRLANLDERGSQSLMPLAPGGSASVLMQPYRDPQYETMTWGVEPRYDDERWLDVDARRSYLFRGLIAVDGVIVGEENRFLGAESFSDMPWFYVGVAAPLAGPGVVPGFQSAFRLLTLPVHPNGSSERLPLVVPRALKQKWLNRQYDTSWIPKVWTAERHNRTWPGD